MSDFACWTCGKSPGHEGVTVIRINPTGMPGIFLCEACHKGPIPYDLREIIAAVTGRPPPEPPPGAAAASPPAGEGEACTPP